MDSRPTYSSPRTREAIEQTFDGFQRALAKMSTKQLMEQAAMQGALLQEQQRAILTSTLLSEYHARTMDQPGPTTPSGPLPPEPRDRPERASPAPSSPPRLTPERAGRRIAAGLARQGQGVSARRARAEGRR